MDAEELLALTLSAGDPPAQPATYSPPFIPPMPRAPQLAPPPAIEPDALPPGFTLGRKAIFLGDVFTGLARFSSRVEKVAWLRYNASPALWYMLQVSLNPNVSWLLPKGLPPYKPFDGKPNAAPSELKRELKRLYLYLKDGNNNLQRVHREKLFQSAIEGLPPDEVAVLIAMKDGALTVNYGIDAELVEAAFPGLLASPVHIRFGR